MSASAAQIAANRENARHSTGPVTPEGKAKSADNSTRHGFYAQSALIPGEDPAEFQALLDELTTHFNPRDLTETRFVRDMTDAEWRLRRARRLEEELFAEAIGQLAAGPNQPERPLLSLHTAALEHLLTQSTLYPALQRWEEKFQRQYDRAYNGWRRYQTDCERRRDRDLAYQMKRDLDPALPLHPVERDPEAPGENHALVSPPITAQVEKRRNEPNSSVPADTHHADTPRSAPCPCGSGQKYKRCCGLNAPPVLHSRAA